MSLVLVAVLLSFAACMYTINACIRIGEILSLAH